MIDEIHNEAKTGMDKAVAHAADEFAAIRTGRANPSLFANVTVEYYGAPTPLNQLASFQNPEARTLLIRPTTAPPWGRSRRRCATRTSAPTRPTTAT